MAEHAHQMRLIQSLDPNAHLCYSKYTDKWYVSARITLVTEFSFSGLAEHRDDVEDAIHAYLLSLYKVGNTPTTLFKEALKASPTGEDRFYTWNGAAFAECSRPTN